MSATRPRVAHDPSIPYREDQATAPLVRLNKLLAERGVAARRKCDLLIAEGRVRVDGEVVHEPGVRVDPTRQSVAVSGKPLPRAEQSVYYALHKPLGVLTTLSDPGGRPTVRAYLPADRRVFPVGRLDVDTSGLLLATTDGELAHRLMHPRYQIPKTYHLTLADPPKPRVLTRLALGVEFAPGETSRPARVEVVKRMGEVTVVALTISEGRNRQVRRMCEALGLELLRLHRVRVGPIEIGSLAPGALRPLTREEVTALRRAVSDPAPTAGKGRVTPRKRRPTSAGRPGRRLIE